ncbi:2OG-Fe(II) oxygenase family protein [Shimia abyssi]|uniref:Isopenicillin N synthase-like dioxygenase n=1 Tax=Shimia abyssi TaxID=1662395 RepID=A0A2P8FG61_9RHOB|nr:2OG-Fe(II) oxygenase family protein [Shimia abyssi]PSL20709.1 isopenicillin N synthase-like dioxygenase [Shimia abyssi]
MDTLVSINIAALFEDSHSARRAVDAQIADAIQRHGGFVISDYPGAKDIDRCAEEMLRYFDLDDVEKLKTAKICTRADAPNIYRGYESNLKPGGFAYNEMFDVGPKSPSAAPTLGALPFAEENVWPETDPTSGWRQAMDWYYETSHSVAMAVLHSVGRSIDLPAATLEKIFSTGNSTLRLINYPLPPEREAVSRESNPDGLIISTSSHTDGSGLSILWSAQRGLQACSPEGVWRDVPQQANCLSVHLGDVVDAMSDGRIPATPHRVVGHGVQRRSVGFFLEPRLDAQLGSAAFAGTIDDIRNSYGWMLQKRFSRYEGYQGIIEAPD